MKITLRRESKLPYWFTLDGSVHLTLAEPEMIVDEATFTDATKREIKSAHQQGRILIDGKISATAENVSTPPQPKSKAEETVESYIQENIDLSKLNVRQAKEVIKGCKDLKTILHLAGQEQQGFARKTILTALTARAKELEASSGPVVETDQELIVLGTAKNES